MSDFKTIDHPPSPEELAEIFKQSEENDPRSLFYKRVLVRPKFPIGKLLLFFFLFVSVAIATYLGMMCMLPSWQVAVASLCIAEIIVAFLLGRPLLITLVHSYQALASNKTRERCRYEPSCSAYMIQAVEKYGFIRGLKKGLKRWRSCKPPNGGFDLP